MWVIERPQRGGSIEDLKRFVNVSGEDDFVLLVGWILCTYMPRAPYPLLVLNGLSGSCKTTACRVVLSLCDPGIGKLRSTPKNEEDLAIGSMNRHVTAFENVSHIPQWLSDALCRLSTGGGFATRRFYTNTGEVIIDVQKPALINGIEEVVTAGDLLDRSFVISLPEFNAERLGEGVFEEAFAVARPGILGALLDAVACALQNVGQTRPRSLPRLADAAIWVTAAEPALGWTSGRFLEAHRKQREASDQTSVEGALIGEPMLRLMAQRDRWVGTAGDLLRQLSMDGVSTVEQRRRNGWPGTPRGMSGALDRIAPQLKSYGITVQRQRASTHKRDRLIEITRTPAAVVPVPQAALDALAQRLQMARDGRAA